MADSSKWIWHPESKENANPNSAGGLLHFRRQLQLIPETLPKGPILLQITADTKYKLYINSKLVSTGPVKGDEHLWFYDEIDVQKYLREGINDIHVRVLRLDYNGSHGTSFARLPFGGLLVRNVRGNSVFDALNTDDKWETALDLTTILPIDIKEDAFLHIYEKVDNRKQKNIEWMRAKEWIFPSTHGISAPWKLAPRIIPFAENKPATFSAIHNLKSSEDLSVWEGLLNGTGQGISLPAGTSHHVELEAEHHLTAFLDFKFTRPATAGSSLKITYSECYEDEPDTVPWIRRKGNRRDNSKLLIGPYDEYIFGGIEITDHEPKIHGKLSQEEETFTPFHWRTFRFLAIDIKVSEDSNLILRNINITTTNYRLEILASFQAPGINNSTTKDLWTTSVRTLRNCMHDCYEDCPFYEQLQYAMDIRSSALFTYVLSGDDRLARQAIIQLHNSYKPSVGLTASRAPAAAQQYQIIPNFSLFWICMVTDHFEHFHDAGFANQFIGVIIGVLETFRRRIDPVLGLVKALDAETTASQWDFVDWAEEWKPFGIPPAGERTGFISVTSMLYAYTLQRVIDLLTSIGRSGLASEYTFVAEKLVIDIKKHCCDGQHFTDGLAKSAEKSDLSQHSQVWAVLSGAATDDLARSILRTSLASSSSSTTNFTRTSLAMSFYTLRALSKAGGSLYNELFHDFWDPWREQLAQGVSTWVEDSVSQRSDCHAWGCAPIYEFLVEVAGVRGVSSDGVLEFRPRLELFEELEAKVALVVDGVRGVVSVSWKKVESGKMRVELKFNFGDGGRPRFSIRAFGNTIDAKELEYSFDID